MKRAGTGRLLTPAMMEGLKDKVKVNGCAVCGSSFVLEAHHLLPQSIIKDEYLKRGGIAEQDDALGLIYRPITRFEFKEPEVSATEIAAHPDTCICLCSAHHTNIEHIIANGNTNSKRVALMPHAEQLVALGIKYSMTHRMRRYYGKEIWDELERKADAAVR